MINEEFELELELFTDEEDEKQSSFVKIKHDVKTRQIVYDNAEKLAYDIDIKKGETVFAITSGNFVFGDFIAAFIQVNDLHVEELTVVSLSGSRENFETLDALMVEGYVDKTNLVLSKYFMRTERAKYSGVYEYLEKFSKKPNVELAYTNTHAKIILMKTEHGFVTMHGSANLRSNGSLEQLMIQENEALYNYNYEYFKTLKNV